MSPDIPFSQDAGSAARKPQRLYAAFEGGGAKGLVHVGALSALEERDVKFMGVAGTSAGAIVACLKAVGYTAAEMIDPTSDQTILSKISFSSSRGMKATDLFGRGGWIKVKVFRWVSVCPRTSLVFALGLSLAVGWAVVALGVNDDHLKLFERVMVVVGAASVTASFGAAMLWFAIRGGLTRLCFFRDSLDRLLSTKMFPDDPKRRVLFGDIRETGHPALKVVASDITTGALRLFSSDDPKDRGIAVADAVAASICLPLIFQPWRLNQSLYLDGGLVSNLPVWPFDERRALDPEAITIAFQIDAVSTDGPPTQTAWLTAAVRTSIFGAGVLDTRSVDHFATVRVRTDLGVLDFDADRKQVHATVEDARKAASAQISRRVFDLPSLFGSACSTVQNVTLQVIADFGDEILRDASQGVLGDTFTPSARRVRVSAALRPEGTYNTLKLRYGVGYEPEDGDEGASLPLDGSLVGEAYLRGEAVIKLAPFPMEQNFPGEAFNKLRHLVARDVQWIAAIPIFGKDHKEGDPPLFVVAIDGSHDLKDDRAKLNEFVVILDQFVNEAFVSVSQDLEV